MAGMVGSLRRMTDSAVLNGTSFAGDWSLFFTQLIHASLLFVPNDVLHRFTHHFLHRRQHTFYSFQG